MTVSPRAALTRVRLTRFKSFAGAELPIGDLTVLTGRNSSGKSNALDAIEVLARLAEGEDLADALDGRRREGGPIRGGSAGCAPHGDTEFSIGCTVQFGEETFEYDLTIQVHPGLRVLAERLYGPCPMIQSGGAKYGLLLDAKASNDENNPALWGQVHNGRKGPNPWIAFRDSRILLSQLPSHVSAKDAEGRDDPAGRYVLLGAQAVIAALRGTFHLDPVPHLMRSYVPARDAGLRRTGENLSASISVLADREPNKFRRLNELVRLVADQPVRSLAVAQSDLRDVMLTIQEGNGPDDATPARELSDGLLRFLAIAVTLLTADRGLDVDPGSLVDAQVQAHVLLVIEELENGLHPSMAARLLSLIRETTGETGAQVILTTHSSALLNALSGNGANSIVVCYRNEATQRSHLARLTELAGYAQAMAQGRIGDLVAEGRLVRPEESSTDPGAVLHLLGMEAADSMVRGHQCLGEPARPPRLQSG
jgi:predicted ATPase